MRSCAAQQPEAASHNLQQRATRNSSQLLATAFGSLQQRRAPVADLPEKPLHSRIPLTSASRVPETPIG
eukprot:3264372-Alexandrium_andersonii.AAC.1